MAETTDHSSHVLYVLRHAKSSWEEPGLEDHDRPLAPRGRKAAGALSRYLQEKAIRPSVVVCSSATRAVETYDGVQPSGELLVERELYGATAAEVIERLREVPESNESAMVIGHNPTMQLLVLWLASPNLSPQAGAQAVSRELERVREKFPTCALATLRFNCPWLKLAPGRAELRGLIRPADLG